MARHVERLHDAGEAVHILCVLVPKHVEQARRINAADRPAVVRYDRNTNEPAGPRDLGNVLLVAAATDGQRGSKSACARVAPSRSIKAARRIAPR
jgi:hypothetical protein